MVGIMILAIILAEIAFWLCLFGGMALRYVFRLPKTGYALLVATIPINLLLLIYTFWSIADMRWANFFHGLGAFYAVFAIAFGKDLIQAMDHKWRGTSDVSGKGFDLTRCVIACVITIVILAAMITLTGLAGSFWLIYWIIAVAFIPLFWWAIDKSQQRRKA